VGCSGALSIFICGMMMRNYAFYSLNMYSKITIEYMVETIAFTIENFVFAYLGL
jgi:NhaP-type Na+/H+ or K+/H+ antiporter